MDRGTATPEVGFEPTIHISGNQISNLAKVAYPLVTAIRMGGIEPPYKPCQGLRITITLHTFTCTRTSRPIRDHIRDSGPLLEYRYLGSSLGGKVERVACIRDSSILSYSPTRIRTEVTRFRASRDWPRTLWDCEYE